MAERDKPELLAICGNCGTIYRARAFAPGPGDPLKCPACDETKRIFDAGDVFGRDILEVLLRPVHTMENLRTYEEVVDNLRGDLSNGALSAEEAPERLRREAPELAKLADVLPRTRSELYGFLALILAAITLYVTIKGEGSQGVRIRVNELTIEQRNLLAQAIGRLKKPPPSAFGPAPETLSKRDMQRRISRANAVRKWGDGQRVLLLFERDDLTKKEEWAALHSVTVERPDDGYVLVREELDPAKSPGSTRGARRSWWWRRAFGG